MTTTPTPLKTHSASARFSVRWLWPAAAVLLLGLGALLVWRWRTAPPPVSDVMPVSPAIEQKWGIRITQIGVTADNGLVDFRYIVIDPDKALALQQDNADFPVLIDEESGRLVNSAALMAPKHTLNAGQTYFILFRDTDGIIKPGRNITVKIGDLKLEHVPAQ